MSSASTRRLLKQSPHSILCDPSNQGIATDESREAAKDCSPGPKPWVFSFMSKSRRDERRLRYVWRHILMRIVRKIRFLLLVSPQGSALSISPTGILRFADRTCGLARTRFPHQHPAPSASPSLSTPNHSSQLSKLICYRSRAAILPWSSPDSRSRTNL